MPARLSLTKAQRAALLTLPDTEEAFIRHYSFSGEDAEILYRYRTPETRLAFALPPGGVKITLRSNRCAPAHVVAESSDVRELGLCVGRLRIDGFPVSLDSDETCGAGWHGAELTDGRFSHRWTTGAMPLPACTRIVILDLAGVGYYWRSTDGRAVALSA